VSFVSKLSGLTADRYTASDLAAASSGNILCKYADDTYVIIPAQNVDTRTAELLNIEAWARDDNITLNTTKSVEILFTDKYRKCQFNPPLDVPGIYRVSSIRILGVTLTNKLTVSNRINNVIQDCSNTVRIAYPTFSWNESVCITNSFIIQSSSCLVGLFHINRPQP